MRAAVLNRGRMLVREDVAEPQPGPGQVLVEVKACGICGSDLHFARHGEAVLELGRRMEGVVSLAGPDELDLTQDVFMGHEFAAEVLEAGPGTEAPRPGTLVTSLPVLIGATGIEPIVYSNRTLGGYAERMLLSAPLLLEVPNGLDARYAALTEPMAVGLHAVNRSGIATGQGALVIGAGPVGLSVVAALRRRAVEPIVVSDPSPARRQLGLAMGAHQAVDPTAASPWESYAAAAPGRALVVFEAVGVPGILDEIMRAAPAGTRVVVVGVCMETDAVNPFYGISKELNLQFVLAYDPMEFTDSLRALAEGEIDVSPMVTAEVSLERVGWAFEALGSPEEHCKILITP